MGINTILSGLIPFGLILLVGFVRTKRKFNDVFKFNKVSPFLWVSTTIFIIGFIILSSELDNLVSYILPMPEFFRNIFESLTAGQTFVFSIISVAVIPAFTEELLFRGLILDGLTRNYSKRKAIVISALLFGLIHLNPWQFVTAFLIGLVSAWICIETNSILLSIFIHLFNNALYTIAMNYRDKISISGFSNNSPAKIEFQPLWLNMAGLVLLIIGTIMLIKGIKKTKQT
jgi:membrane protease YdiL (CAAX protease family)